MSLITYIYFLIITFRLALNPSHHVTVQYGTRSVIHVPVKQATVTTGRVQPLITRVFCSSVTASSLWTESTFSLDAHTHPGGTARI